MRIRTILAAAAAPAALAAVLLGTAGQASAAVAAPTQATLTASVQKAVTYKANTHQHGLADTTSVDTTDSDNATINNDSQLFGPIGPVWAYDNMERQLTATDNGPVVGNPALHSYSVTITSIGQYNAFAEPIHGHAWTGTGPVNGYVNYTVVSDHAPNGDNLPAQLDATYPQAHSGDIVRLWFGSSVNVTGLGSHFEYKGIPGATDGPGGLYIQQ
jgi:hypothetical protein